MSVTPYKIDGRPLTGANLVALVADAPCTLCHVDPPSHVALYEPPDDEEAREMWDPFRS